MGAQVAATNRAVEVFSSSPRPSASHDAVSLETLHCLNPKPSQATLRTREKIGLGEKKIINHIVYSVYSISKLSSFINLMYQF